MTEETALRDDIYGLHRGLTAQDLDALEVWLRGAAAPHDRPPPS